MRLHQLRINDEFLGRFDGVIGYAIGYVIGYDIHLGDTSVEVFYV